MIEAAPPTAGLEVRAAVQQGKQCQLVDRAEAVKLLDDSKHVVWIDVLVSDEGSALELLSNQMKFHELAVEDALHENERATFQQYDDYIFFSIPAFRANSSKHETVELGFFLTSSALVTVSTAHVAVVDEWFKRWTAKPELMHQTAAVLMHSVVDAVVDSYFPVVDALEDELDDLSDRIFGGDTGGVKDILLLKRQFLDFRRKISPTRDVLNALLRRDIELVPESTKPYFQDVLDHVLRISEVLDMNRETLASLLDVHLSQVSNNLNLVVKKMTVVATVLMIMTLIAGIYGMNFKFMPELHWPLGYPFALGLMLASAAITLWVFRKVRWL